MASHVLSSAPVSIRVPLTIEGRLPPAGEAALPRLKSTEVTLEGNPAAGVVHHFGYHHLSKFGSDREELIEGGERKAALLREVMLLGPSCCFVEGCDVDSGPESISDIPKELLNALEAAFPQKEIPAVITEEQALTLGQAYIADLVYFFCPSTTIYGTEPSDDRFLKHAYKSNDEVLRDAIIFDYRETIALDKIISVLNAGAPGNRTAALIYGGSHSFSSPDLPVGISADAAPLVVKYNFEDWSIFSDTQAVIEAASEDAQLEAVRNAGRILAYAWRDAKSAKVQHEMLPRLKTDPDFYDTPDEFLNACLSKLHEGALKEEVAAALRQAHAARSGPFADLCIREGGEDLLEKARGEFPSIYVFDELHPYTQLELIRAAPELIDYCFSRIITAKGQAAALTKLVPDIETDRDKLMVRLLSCAVSDKVKAEILRRYEGGEAPFSLCDQA